MKNFPFEKVFAKPTKLDKLNNAGNEPLVSESKDQAKKKRFDKALI